MLSELLRYAVVGDRGQRAKLADLAVDLAAGDYPSVTRLYYTLQDGTQRSLPLLNGHTFDWHTHEIRMPRSLTTGDPVSPEALEGEVLLKRDVLDALVLELQQRRATRANDLALEDLDGQMRLCAADTSPWGVLRRLSGGWLKHVSGRDLFDWKYVEFLRGDPGAALRGRDYHRRIARLPAGDIARLSDALPYLHAAELVSLLPDSVAADTLEALSPERQVQVFEELGHDQARRLLLLMRPDIVADLLGHLDPEEARRWLEGIPAIQRDRVIGLLRYPGDTVGGIMTNDLVTLPPGLSSRDAREALRELLRKPHFINFIYDVYVVEAADAQRLLGAVRLRDLIVADEGKRLQEIMNPYLVTLHPLQPASDAARRVIDSGMPALPVVARDRRLLGAVTVDAALPLVAPESWRSQSPNLFS